MSERVRWTCPNCNRTFSVPTTEGLTVCPKCVASQLPVTSISADASVQSPAVRHRTASVFATVVSIPPVVFRWCLASLPKLKAIPVVVVLAILGSGTIGFLLGRLSVSAIPRLIPTVLIDPDKALAMKLLKENLNDPHWEEVKWWPPVDQTEETQQIIAEFQQRAANPNVPPKDAILQKLGFTGNYGYPAYYGDAMLHHLKSAPPRIARLKYRTKNAFGAMTIHDELFLFRDNSVESRPVPSIRQIDALFKQFGLGPKALDYFIAPSVAFRLDIE